MQHRLRTVISTSIAAVLTMLWGSISVAEAMDPESFATAPDVASKDLANAREGCSGIGLAVEPVQFSSKVEGAVLHITSSQAGCLGATGEYQLLAVKGGDGRWRNAFKAYSQIIMVDTIGRSGVASFAVKSVLGCTQSFTWSGQRYAERREVTGLAGCGNGPFPAGVHAIEAALAF